jgi:ADP-ribosyl-[dinitrogen reductase] hydrolase
MTKDPAARDSVNSPLMIDSVSLTCGGEIGMTICPGKRGPSDFGGFWNRDLDTDIRAITEWKPSIVVTLMEADELDRMGVGALGEAIERAGMDWHFLPIVDVSVLGEHFENLWIYSGHVLRNALMLKKKILIHCRGGLGRTGTIAARLMIELGERPATAIRKVREARTGAIETPEQERYVRAVRPALTNPMAFDRVLGCLLGGAVGDAFGYEVEFHSWRKIKATFGPDGITYPVAHDGQIIVSDDTQMTLFTLEGMIQSREALAWQDVPATVEAIRLAYLDWLYTQGDGDRSRNVVGRVAKDARLRKLRAPGNTCLAALRAGGRGSPEKPINDSKGCGGVMRVAPLGLLRELAPTEVAELAARAAALTHGHPSGYLSAAAMAAIVRLSLDDSNLAANAEAARDIVSKWKGSGETVARIDGALAAARTDNESHRKAVKSLGEGWVGEEALAIGLYSALVGRTFSEVLSIAANHDGDSDSTASIAGQLYGAANGLADLPNQWVRQLDILDISLKLIGEKIL